MKALIIIVAIIAFIVILLYFPVTVEVSFLDKVFGLKVKYLLFTFFTIPVKPKKKKPPKKQKVKAKKAVKKKKDNRRKQNKGETAEQTAEELSDEDITEDDTETEEDISEEALKEQYKAAKAAAKEAVRKATEAKRAAKNAAQAAKSAGKAAAADKGSKAELLITPIPGKQQRTLKETAKAAEKKAAVLKETAKEAQKEAAAAKKAAKAAKKALKAAQKKARDSISDEELLEGKKSKRNILDFIKEKKRQAVLIWSLVKKNIFKIIKNISADKVHIDMTAAGEDAFEAAKLYGTLSAAVRTAAGFLGTYTKVKYEYIGIKADFTVSEPVYNISARVKMTPAVAVGNVIAAAFKVLINLKKIKTPETNERNV